MTDTVTKLMNMSREIEEIAALCADPMNSETELDEYRTDLHKARQALEAELTRLFTPLSDEQAKLLAMTYSKDPLNLIFQTEVIHGIGGGES